MRFRLRTLLVVVTVAAIVAAMAGFILSAYRPIAIWRSFEGRRAIQRLSGAQQISVEMYIDGTNYTCDLSPESRTALLSWLKRGVRDVHPAKRTMLGVIRLQSSKGNEWLVLQINPNELSVQTPDGTWRGLNRSQLERIARECDLKSK